MTAPVSTEQLLVQVLLRQTHDALLSLELEDEATATAPRELGLAFASLWTREPSLEVSVSTDGLEWDGAIVLGPDDDVAGIAAMLAEAGIRQLTLTPGVEDEEILRLLDVLDRKRRLDVGGDLDLASMLFHEDFQHARYTLAGPSGIQRPDTPPTGSAPSAPAPGLAIREAVREDVATEDRRRGIVELERFDSTLYFLDQREIEYLRAQIDRQYEQDHARSVLELLLDTLELRTESEVRSEVLAVLAALLPYLLGTGQFESVAYLTHEIRALGQKLELEPEHKEAMDALRVSVSETRALAQLFHALDGGEVEADAANLGVLLGELRPQAIRTVLVWVGQLTRPDAKAALVEALDTFFTRWPGALGRMLAASDRIVVHRALGMATRLRRPEFAEHVALTSHGEDVTTRRLAARALKAIGSAPALRALVQMMDDDDGEVRRIVFETFATRPYRGAEGPLTAALGAGDVEQRELGERRALFAAYGAVSGPEGVPRLEPVLRGRGSLGRRPSSETRACAAVALGIIGTPAARSALEQATRDRDPLVRTAALTALRGED